MERTQIYFQKSQIKRLKTLAQKKKTTLSELVRDAVEVQYAPKIELKARERRETLLEFSKRINSMGFKGPKDLATNMDEYLYGGKK